MKKSKIFSLNNKKTGFTLLELLLVLGIIAVLTIAAFVIFPKVRTYNQAQTETNNITTIATGVKNIFASTNSYTDSSGNPLNLTPTLIQAKVFPSNMLNSMGNDVHSSFNTPVTVQTDADPAADGTSANFSMFEIIYDYVPSDVCIKLATGVGANFQNVLVNGVGVFTTRAPYHPAPIAASKQCNTTAPISMRFISN